jgi:DNA polymerase-3 subunit beta
MKLTCTKDKLKKAIFSIEKISSKQTSLPILKNIMLRAKEGKLFFYATNLEIGIICNIRAKVQDEGEFSVPARLLSDYVNNLPDKNDSLEMNLVDGSFLNVISGEYNSKIKGMSCEDFPIIPKPSGECAIVVDNSDLKNSLSRVLGCVSNNDTRIEFTGVNLSFENDGIYLAATDGFKLAEGRIELGGDVVNTEKIDAIKDSSIIIPVVALFELSRVISSESGKTEIFIENNQIFFNVNDEVSIVSKLINGKYPNYRQIIPLDFKTEVVIDKDELLKSVKIASVFTSTNSKEVSLEVNSEEGVVIIESKFQDFGENKVELKPIKIQGDNQKIVLNPKYIIDGLNLISSSEVIVLLNDDISPIAFRNIDDNKVDENYIYIMMPVKK